MTISLIHFLYEGIRATLSSSKSTKGAQMRGLALYFMLAGVVCGLCGMVWGIQMAATGNHLLSPAHGHLNLLGWVSLSLMGLYYHAVPSAAQSGLARLHLAVALAGVILIVPGIALVLSGGSAALAKIGSLVVLLSMLLFLAVILRSRGSQP